MQNLYKIPNLKLEAIDVFTNSYKSGPYRCVSHPNGTFALELMMEKAAYAVGMDPVEFRLKNLNEQGNPDTKKPFSNPGIRDCITAAATRIGWKAKWHAPRAREVRPGIFHGIGLAAHSCSHGAGTNPATGQVIVNSDGSVQCVSACTEIGPGQRTEMAMITAEALGVPLSKVSITTYVDTDNTTDTGGTNGSRQTNTGGRGIYEAAIDAKKQILKYAAAHDVGRALNPFALEQQIEGGVVMALGAVFNEQLLTDASTGLPLNANMLDYRPPSILDVPEEIDIVLIEKPKAYGVFGAHGIGEPPMGPPAPAVAAAVYNAVGVWMESMPLTREKLLAELRKVR